MSHLILFLVLVCLHLIFYSVFERLSILTLLYSLLWSILALGIYGLWSLKLHKPLTAISVSAACLAVIYFFVYIYLVYPSFIELRMFGINIVHSGTLTAHGWLYIVLASICEGALVVIAFLLRGLLSQFFEVG
jgi:hypothetical protein